MVFAAICLLSASSFANPMTYYLAAGDAVTAALNNVGIGRALPAAFTIPSASASTPATFTVQLWALENSGMAQAFSSGSVMLGFDRANGASVNYSNWAAFQLAALDHQLLMPSTASMNFSTILPGVDAFNNVINVSPNILAGPAYANAFGAGSSLRAAGVWAGFNFGAGNKLALAANSAVHLATFSLGSMLLQGQQYQNLTIVDIQGASSRSTTLRPEGDDSVRYSVTAVPEPSCLFGFGIAATVYAVRRRKR